LITVTADICGKYSSAGDSTQALQNECNITAVVLNHTKQLLLDKQKLFTGSGLREDVVRSFETSLRGIERTISFLYEKVAPFEGGSTKSFRNRVNFVSNENEFKKKPQVPKDQRSTMDFLLQCIQK
jgi:hypothetical protein